MFLFSKILFFSNKNYEVHSCVKLSYTDHDALQIHSISLHSSDLSVVGKKKRDKCSLCIYLLYVRELSGLGRRPDLEWGRAEIDNGAAKWPLSWNIEMERKPLYSMYIPLSLSPLPWRRAVRMWSVRVLTEEDMAATKTHGHNLTLYTGFRGRARGWHKLFLARSC